MQLAKTGENGFGRDVFASNRPEDDLPVPCLAPVARSERTEARGHGERPP
jgi:hypothetical protein